MSGDIRHYIADILESRGLVQHAQIRAAIADALVEDLGLTPESAPIPEVVGRVEHSQPCAVPDHMIAGEDMHTCGYRRGHYEFPQKTRYVTSWERDA